MKTSVIEVHDMLSVLSVDEVEKRIGEVPGVESVTVNYAAGSATIRYDETRLEIADIKSAVRQAGYESVTPSGDSAGGGHEDHAKPGAPPVTLAPAPPKSAPDAAPSTTRAAPPKPSPAPAPPNTTSAGDGKKDKTPMATQKS